MGKGASLLSAPKGSGCIQTHGTRYLSGLKVDWHLFPCYFLLVRLRKVSFWVLIFTLMAGGAYLILGKGGKALLPYLGKATKAVSYYLLTAVGVSPEGGPTGALRLVIPGLSPHCIQANSIGLSGIGLFLLVFAAFWAVRRKQINFKMWFAVLAFGILFMFFLNALRLALSISLEFKLHQWLANAQREKAYLDVIKNSMGWLVYGSGIILLLKLASPRRQMTSAT